MQTFRSKNIVWIDTFATHLNWPISGGSSQRPRKCSESKELLRQPKISSKSNRGFYRRELHLPSENMRKVFQYRSLRNCSIGFGKMHRIRNLQPIPYSCDILRLQKTKCEILSKTRTNHTTDLLLALNKPDYLPSPCFETLITPRSSFAIQIIETDVTMSQELEWCSLDDQTVHFFHENMLQSRLKMHWIRNAVLIFRRSNQLVARRRKLLWHLVAGVSIFGFRWFLPSQNISFEHLWRTLR